MNMDTDIGKHTDMDTEMDNKDMDTDVNIDTVRDIDIDTGEDRRTRTQSWTRT